MDTKERDELLSFLFDKDGCEIVNVKFFRGPKKVGSEALCREAHRALREAFDGPEAEAPVSGIKSVTRAELVKSI